MGEDSPAGIARGAFGSQICNPCDTDTWGESSGGSAAAVAANLAMCAPGHGHLRLGALSVIRLRPNRARFAELYQLATALDDI